MIVVEPEVVNVESHPDPAIDNCLKLGMLYYPNIESVPERAKNSVKATFFSPSAEEAEWMHLERCLRCVPQDEVS